MPYATLTALVSLLLVAVPAADAAEPGAGRASAAAADAATGPSAEEAAILLRLNEHRSDRLMGDHRILEAILAKEIPTGRLEWERSRSKEGSSPPVAFDPALGVAARALLQARATMKPGERFDASAALAAAGHAAAGDHLALIAHDAPNATVAYATAMTAVISSVPYGKSTKPVFAGPESLKEIYRACGVAVTSARGKTSLVILVAAGAAKRHVGGVAFLDRNHDGRYDPGEGREGVTVRCGGLDATTGPSGLWSLALPDTDAAEVAFAFGDQQDARPLEAGAATAQIAWRIPEPDDLRQADRLIAAAEKAVAGSDQAATRRALADLLALTRLPALDAARRQRVTTLTEPVREEFHETLAALQEALPEDPPTFKKALAAQRKRWSGAMPAWFKEVEALHPLRAQVMAVLAAPAEGQAKLKAPALAQVAKALERTVDPQFRELYVLWSGQLDRARGEAFGPRCER